GVEPVADAVQRRRSGGYGQAHAGAVGYWWAERHPRSREVREALVDVLALAVDRAEQAEHDLLGVDPLHDVPQLGRVLLGDRPTVLVHHVGEPRPQVVAREAGDEGDVLGCLD